jgi:anti-sigma factor RsiW
MPQNPACPAFIPLLSPFIDGELTPADRVNVERHLAACQACTGRAADLRAESGLVRVGLEMAADDVDFKDFSLKVMARLTPYKPPLLERLRVSVSETFRYQRTAMISSMATAAALVLIAVPLLMDRTPLGYAQEQMAVESVTTEQGAQVAPVVLTTDEGDAIIWLVDHSSADQSLSPPSGDDDDEDDEEDATGVQKTRPHGGEL